VVVELLVSSEGYLTGKFQSLKVSGSGTDQAQLGGRMSQCFQSLKGLVVVEQNKPGLVGVGFNP